MSSSVSVQQLGQLRACLSCTKALVIFKMSSRGDLAPFPTVLSSL